MMLSQWLKDAEAASHFDPTAMALATATPGAAIDPPGVVCVKLCKKVIMAEADRLEDQAATRSISFFCSARSVMFR